MNLDICLVKYYVKMRLDMLLLDCSVEKQNDC